MTARIRPDRAILVRVTVATLVVALAAGSALGWRTVRADGAPIDAAAARAVAGVWSVDDAGKPTSDHTYWRGFQQRTALGLRAGLA